MPVYSPDNILCDYDFMIVASTYGNEILELIHKNNISMEKVCFIHVPFGPQIDIAKNYSKIKNHIDVAVATQIEGYRELADNYVKKDKLLYNQLNKRKSMHADDINDDFYFTDKFDNAGTVSNYFWQDLWAARLIHENAPEKHFDIGSRVDGFIAHLLSFRKEVFLIDIRPLPYEVDGINFVQGDATNLNEIPDESIESLSALCSLEHFGLGRYGDPIDPEACFKAFDAIQRKIKSGGFAYISVPIGREHVEFNGCRIFYAKTVLDAFNQMELQQLDAASSGKIEYNIDIHKYDTDTRKRANIYGLFVLKKK